MRRPNPAVKRTAFGNRLLLTLGASRAKGQTSMQRKLSVALVAFLLSNSVIAEGQCTDRPECWPEGSSMHTGLMLVQKQKAVEKTLERSHAELLQLVSSTRSSDGSLSTDERLLKALKTQQVAWLKYRDEECELIGSLTGAGGTWPSTYANQCAVNHGEQRVRRVRSATRCIERLPSEKRIFEQNNCLQQLAPLTNK